MTAQQINWRLWAMRLLLLVAVPLVSLTVLEVVLRVAGYGYPTDFVLRDGDSCTSNDRFGWRFFPRPIATTPWPFRVAANKPAGVYRIVILGESAAEGTPNPSFSFGRMLEAMLRLEFPERRFEVVNAAMTAINSHVIRLIAEDCCRLKPDLVVIYMGNNEVIGPFGPGSVFGGELTSCAIIRGSLWLNSTRVGQLIRGVLGWFGGVGKEPAAWQGMEMFLKNQVAADDPRLAAVYENFRANLDDIMETCRSDGAQVVVATVASNLRDCPPFASAHRAGLSDDAKRRWEAIYQSGVADEAIGRRWDAAAAYARAAAIDDRFAELVFRMGECGWRVGEYGQAQASYAKARDLDTLRFRADSRINEIIRAAVSVRGDVALADSEEAFAASEWSAHGSPGEALFYEHVHMTPRGNYLLAKTVRLQIGDLPKGRSGVPPLAMCSDWLGLSEVDEFRMTGAMAAMTARPPFSNQPGHAARQARRTEALNRFRARVMGPALERARAVYLAALRRSPEDWQLRNSCGQLLMMVGDFGSAAAQWQAALAGVPADSLMAAELNLNIGEAIGRLGRFDEAMPRFEAAARAWRDSPEPHRGLGEIFAAKQRYGEAAAEFEKAIRLNPNHVPAINGLGMVKFRTNDFAGAASEFGRALAIEQSAPAHVNRGMALEKLGRADEAVAHYRRALQLDPNAASARERLEAAQSAAGRGGGR